jgi:hypothetical protein
MTGTPVLDGDKLPAAGCDELTILVTQMPRLVSCRIWYHLYGVLSTELNTQVEHAFRKRNVLDFSICQSRIDFGLCIQCRGLPELMTIISTRYSNSSIFD